ncbi:uncharacterized protein [Watersipora subatra]|uniref:uncharacterized protein n=1 Tax=Watersipora subatra TaxID=2589382 RepID=UPI00355B95B4
MPTIFLLRVGILHDILLGMHMTLGTSYRGVAYYYSLDPRYQTHPQLEHKVARTLELVNDSKHKYDNSEGNTDEYLKIFEDLAKSLAAARIPVLPSKEEMSAEVLDCLNTYETGVQMLYDSQKVPGLKEDKKVLKEKVKKKSKRLKD